MDRPALPHKLPAALLAFALALAVFSTTRRDPATGDSMPTALLPVMLATANRHLPRTGIKPAPVALFRVPDKASNLSGVPAGDGHETSRISTTCSDWIRWMTPPTLSLKK